MKHAQISTAQLNGTVTDQRGALVQGAPGPYRLQISFRGFSTYEQAGIVLHVATSQVIRPGYTSLREQVCPRFSRLL